MSLTPVYTGEIDGVSYFQGTDPSIFLAGPTYRRRDENTKGLESWRVEALRLLTVLDFEGYVFIPEMRDKSPKGWNLKKQVKWETEKLAVAKRILFWIPRKLDILPGFTTNIEFGEYLHSGKIIVGFPAEAEKMGYIKERLELAGLNSYSSLKATVCATIGSFGVIK